MEVFDALLATQWGLLGVFGVVIGLLIAPAERHLQEFLASGSADDQRRAHHWAISVRSTAGLVLLALVGLSALGARDAGWNGGAWLSTVTWLLVAPPLAQAGFVILVLFLVRRVPKLLMLNLDHAAGTRLVTGWTREANRYSLHQRNSDHAQGLLA